MRPVNTPVGEWWSCARRATMPRMSTTAGDTRGGESPPLVDWVGTTQPSRVVRQPGRALLQHARILHPTYAASTGYDATASVLFVTVHTPVDPHEPNGSGWTQLEPHQPKRFRWGRVVPRRAS